MLNSGRHLFLTGEPGSGKSEVIVHAACAAAKSGACVLVLCPTGTRVHSYRDRLPDVDNIVVETIHSGFAIQRQYDKLVDYAPPSRLRRYDLILVDEASQIEGQVATWHLMGIQEVPQNRIFIGNRGGSAGGLGSQNQDFLTGKCISLQGTSGGQIKCVDASEAQTLVFFQENVHFH